MCKVYLGETIQRNVAIRAVYYFHMSKFSCNVTQHIPCNENSNNNPKISLASLSIKLETSHTCCLFVLPPQVGMAWHGGCGMNHQAATGGSCAAAAEKFTI